MVMILTGGRSFVAKGTKGGLERLRTLGRLALLSLQRSRYYK